MLEAYHGGCHCGRVRFRIEADLGTIGECNCSIRTKKGILHLPVPLDRFKLLCGEGELTTYRFNTGTAQHTFCRHCGADSGGSRPRIRDDVAHHSDLMSLGLPR